MARSGTRQRVDVKGPQCDKLFIDPTKMSLHPTIFAEAAAGPEVWIRVVGNGSFQNAPALRDFAIRKIAEGRRQFVVDLKDCPMMDSTFMGILAGLVSRLRDAGGGEIWVANRNLRNQELLAGLGFDVLFSDKPVPASPCGCGGTELHFSANKAVLRDVMSEAHAACMAADPKNEEKFRDVMDNLKASADRAKAG